MVHVNVMFVPFALTIGVMALMELSCLVTGSHPTYKFLDHLTLWMRQNANSFQSERSAIFERLRFEETSAMFDRWRRHAMERSPYAMALLDRMHKHATDLGLRPMSSTEGASPAAPGCTADGRAVVDTSAPSAWAAAGATAAAASSGIGSTSSANSESARPRILAVGDSITWGGGSSDTTTHAWPVQLSNMLQGEYEVVNLGLSGRTMMRTGEHPYIRDEEYKTALEMAANTDLDDGKGGIAEHLTIMLGTNDAKRGQWNATQYVNDYRDFVRSFVFENVPGAGGEFLDVVKPHVPQIWLLLPPPIQRDGVWGKMAQDVLNGVLPGQQNKGKGLIEKEVLDVLNERDFAAAIKAGSMKALKMIDVFDQMGGAALNRYQWWCDRQCCDTVHPNDAGHSVLAAAVYASLFNKGVAPWPAGELAPEPPVEEGVQVDQVESVEVIGA